MQTIDASYRVITRRRRAHPITRAVASMFVLLMIPFVFLLTIRDAPLWEFVNVAAVLGSWFLLIWLIGRVAAFCVTGR